MEDIVVGVCTSSVSVDEGIGDDEDMTANVVSSRKKVQKKASGLGNVSRDNGRWSLMKAWGRLQVVHPPPATRV